MQQSNGSKLFHTNDPRSTAIGIIEADPDDDRQSILTAILTQEKLGRKGTAVVIPAQNKAFRRPTDFEQLEQTLEGLQTQIAFVVPQASAVAKFARQHRYPVFLSLEKYAQYVQTFLNHEPHEEVIPITPALEPQEPVLASPPPPLPAPPAIEDEKTQPLPKKPSGAPEQQVARAEPAVIAPEPPVVVPEPPPTTPAIAPVPSRVPVPYEREPEEQPAAPVAAYEPEEPPTYVPPAPIAQEAAIPPVHSAPIEEEIERTPAPAAPTPQEADSRASRPEPVLAVATPRASRRSRQVTQPDRVHEDIPVAPPVAQPPARMPVAPRRLYAVRRRRSGWLPALLILLLLLLIGATVGSVLTGIGPLAQYFPAANATVTIVPDTANVANTYTISAVTGVPDPTQQQIAAHFLSSTSPSQSKTTQASGIGVIPARQAQGSLTFFNALPYQQIIHAGTVLTDANGVQVVNDQQVTIAGAQPSLEGVLPPTQGVAVAPAHALTPGLGGDIAPFDFKLESCCLPGITVENTTAFHGGQDQQTYPYIQQSDIDSTANELSSSLAPGGQQALQNQVSSNEHPIGTSQCKPDITSTPNAGDRAMSVTVTVKVTCTQEVYDQREAQALAENLLKADGIKTPGSAYAPASHIATKILTTRVTDQRGTVTLRVQAQGTWAYQFSDDWKKHMATLIAGKNIREASGLLLQQKGVKQAYVTMIGGRMPLDPQNITIQTDTTGSS